MRRQIVTSSNIKNAGYASDKGKESSLVADLKSLFKFPVLIANAVPVFAGFWLAIYFTEASFASNFDTFLLTIIGSTLVMAGALVFNNWYDVDIDTVMDRTKSRPTVTGNISLQTVLGIAVAASVLGLLLLSFTTLEAVLYAFIGWFTYVVFYTIWSKRRYTLNTVIGSVSGAVTPLIGWAAMESASHIVPIILALIIFLWQMPHTFAIAIRKYDEYKAANVKMLPVIHGMEITKRQMVVYIACLLPLPFYLFSLGTVFVVIATLLNIAYLALAISGLFSADTRKWADKMFMVSVNYLMVIFVAAIVVTLPWFS
ncbi:heme o synthase [Lentibacillus amyloliquefaciens]|uniref:Protoheme IX farnesyltransferase n=1 Tax=Lentibacillus amyloliquefaciens TaxID=1472767 RepID=A0A0U3W7A3_9BACI|nr:heme o synthase [Lentibacillus amyloliquefaciens]ALX49026.1 protoheme IX farnesyltransferase [Lentibacillus amyloliquefaciens]